MSQVPSPVLPWVPIYHEIWETGVFRSELCFPVFSQDPVWGFQSRNDKLFELSVPGELCLCLMPAESQLAAATAQMSPGASLWNRWINHMRSEARLGLSGSVSDKRLPAIQLSCVPFSALLAVGRVIRIIGFQEGKAHPISRFTGRSGDLQPWASRLGYKAWKATDLMEGAV